MDEMDPMSMGDDVEETEEEELASAGMHIDNEDDVLPPEEDMLME